MKGNDPEFVEALRLALKFFPESRSFLTSETGFDWDTFLGAMMVANYSADYSCYPFRGPTDPDFGFAAQGGFDGDDDVVYRDLLNHTGISPRGRAIVVLDAIGQTGQSTEDYPPFVCHSRTVPERLTEIPCFGQCRDVIFIFESGEALLVDHDDRIHWSTSRERADTKITLWKNFADVHNIVNRSVPLFDIKNGCVTVIQYGRNDRLVLKRSTQMEALMRGLGRQLIEEHLNSNVTNDGILYMMLSRHDGRVKPLYIGKAETLGKGDGNLSANISDLATGHGKFGRWGYNYAYHLGDLSAVTCDGHPKDKSTTKYTAWRDKLFLVQDGQVTPKTEILFWATLWDSNCQSIWQEYGSTKLAFEEYLVIGVASDVFPDSLLNREGRTR